MNDVREARLKAAKLAIIEAVSARMNGRTVFTEDVFDDMAAAALTAINAIKSGRVDNGVRVEAAARMLFDHAMPVAVGSQGQWDRINEEYRDVLRARARVILAAADTAAGAGRDRLEPDYHLAKDHTGRMFVCMDGDDAVLNEMHTGNVAFPVWRAADADAT